MAARIARRPGFFALDGGARYTDEQVAWLKAMLTFQQRHGRMPNLQEVLAIAKSLGYRK